ncbi:MULTISPECIES: DedA family protein [unclassified Arthrobacter]|uniref:DedA family protein n=1 Tax=unclassified Arthrobacter TaxID=235627 RepID=UPI000CE40BD7|nr:MULTISPECIES: VTT domain-containing protein [unclassified Arthrobacter]
MSDSALPALVGHGAVPALGLLPDWLDPMNLLNHPALGFWVVIIACGIIFAETGLLVGFFLPGDSLLFTAGLLVSTGAMPVNIWVLMGLLIVSGFIGNQLGYFIGYKAGPAIFNKPESKLFKKQHVDSAHAFFERHGGKALILARFVPIVRTFVPVIVGVAKMDMRKFVLFNAIGAVAWAGGVTYLGYVLGNNVPWVQHNLDIIFLAIVAVSIIPIGIEFLKAMSKHRKKKASEA